MMLDNPERTSRGERSADLQRVCGEPCPTCHELFDLFMLRHVAVAIFDEARRAHEMHGRWCGVLLTDPKSLPDYMRSHLLAPKEPMVEKLHQDDPAQVALAPSRARKSADAAPAMARRPSRPEPLTLDPRLVRMVLRVYPELQEELITLSERLYDETRLEYSYAAIIRGLIALGLASIDGKASLAVEFAGARVPRGRKRGERWRSSNTKDE